MLKEGWDVTNLYTIIPLRTATSLTLREQTIGRGLRLPYGRVTGNKAVDKLTIVAHDKFEEIIAAANEETSIIKKENIIDIEDDEDYEKEKEVFKANTVFDDFIEQKEKNLKFARSDKRKQELQEEIETAQAVGAAIEQILSQPVNIMVPIDNKSENEIADNKNIPTEKSLASNITKEKLKKIVTMKDLNKPEVIEIIKEKAKENLEKDGQLRLNTEEIDKKIELAISPLTEQKIKYTIEIPDIAVVAKGGQKKIYHEFELDTSYWSNFYIPEEEIVIETLKDNSIETLQTSDDVVLPDSMANILINEIFNITTSIDFRTSEALLYHLVEQAISFVGKEKSEKDTEKIIYHHKKEIAKLILSQMEYHSELTKMEYEIKLIRNAAPILKQDYTKFKEDEIIKYTQNIPAYEIKKKVVGHFERACHTAYKFDSVPEHIFSVVLERSDEVEKWLRPAKHQFKIHWKAGREYEPDFVVETKDFIYIVEIKAYNMIDNEEVQLKAKAAETYCNYVNTIFKDIDNKKWKFILLEDIDIHRNSSFKDLKNNSRYR